MSSTSKLSNGLIGLFAFTLNYYTSPQFVHQSNSEVTIFAPSDAIVDCDDPMDPSSTGEPTSVCNILSYTYTDDPPGAGSCPTEYFFFRHFDVNTDCGSAVVTQLITVADNNAPNLICPNNAITPCIDHTDPIVTGQAVATDCSDNLNIFYNDTQISSYPPYNILRRWYATDECNNTSLCVQFIEAIDGSDPLPFCPFDAFVSDINNAPPAVTGTAQTHDNCSTPVNLSYSDGPISGSPPFFIRTWLVEDVYGNSNECQQVITEGQFCPVLGLDIGDPCDDEDPETLEDQVNAQCECMGFSVFDCPSLQMSYGESCDDGDPDTENDTVSEDCECEGSPISPITEYEEHSSRKADMVDGVSPNPTRGIIRIDTKNSDEEIQAVELIDMHGRLVQLFSAPMNKQSPTVDISAHPPGMYHLRLIGNEKIQTIQLVLER